MLPWRRNNFNFPTTRLVSAQTERKTELSFSRQKPLSSVWDTHYEQQNMLQTLNIIKCKQPKFFDSYIEFLVCVCIGFKTFSSVVRHLDSVASYLPTGLHLGFFRSWPSLFLPSSFSSVFLVLSFVLAIHYSAILGSLSSAILWAWPYLDEGIFCRVSRFAWCNDPESYAGGSVATGWATLAGQVKGEHPDKERYTGPPVWGLGRWASMSSPDKKNIC